MPRSLPSNPSLEYDRKRAKALLRRLRRRDAAAAARVSEHHPRWSGRSPDAIFAESPKLSDAQLVIAREYGFRSWNHLAANVRFASAALAEKVDLLLAASRHARATVASEMLERDPAIARADIYAACTSGQAETVRAILQADPSRAVAPGGVFGWEPIFYAGYSRLHLAGAGVSAGIVGCVRALLDHGADPNASCVTPEFPDHRLSVIFAATAGSNHPALAKLLLEAGADPDDDETLYHATELPDSACLDLLLPVVRRPNCNALNRMLDFEDPVGVRKLLDVGADPNHAYPHTRNRSLHHAVSMGRSPEVIGLLIASGAEIDARGERERTPYQLAARSGFVAVQEVLRAAGCDTAMSSREEFLAACARADRAEVARLLGVECLGAECLGAEPSLVSSLDPEDSYVLDMAARSNHSDAVALMLEVGFSPNVAHDGMPALCHAAWWGCPESVRLLLAHGADPHQRNSFGGDALSSTLHGSIHCKGPRPGDPAAGRAPRPPRVYAEIVSTLIASGADPSAIPDERLSALESELPSEVLDVVLAHRTGA